MQVINARNVHCALPEGVRMLKVLGEERDSRNGPVRVMPGPVTTVYRCPTERVILWPERDANPFFHLMEGLWMLAGRDDLGFLTQFVKTFANYSDDGMTLHGAYGRRWRSWFGFDQLGHIIEALRENPHDRRQVLQMWDATSDLGRDGKDVPCNTQVYFGVNSSGRLDMTVCCRSNDMVWGAYGANGVHFSMLQEYMAAAIEVEVGQYWQVSNNFHAYLDTLQQVESLVDRSEDCHRPRERGCPYATGRVAPFPLVSTPIRQWQQDLAMFMEEGPVVGLRDPFFRRVAIPMLLAHQAYKQYTGAERYDVAQGVLGQCRATDWRLAGEQWIEARRQAWVRRSDDGVVYD